jgi:ATP-binding cassette subfamily B protein
MACVITQISADRFWRFRVAAAEEHLEKAVLENTKSIFRAYENLRTLKSFSETDIQSEQFARIDRNATERELSLLRLVALRQATLACCTGIFGLLLAVRATSRMLTPGPKAGTIVALISCFTLFSVGVEGAIGGLSTMERARVAFYGLRNLLSFPQEGTDLEALKSESRFSEAIVRAELVDFSYSCHAPVIRQASFTIQSGEHVAIIGRTGTGKSTLGELICGFLAPTDGQLTVAGIAVSEKTLANVRRLVAVASQECFLVPGTVRENLLLGGSAKSDRELYDMLDVVELRDEIMALPNALGYQIEDRGSGLSTGQRQRLNLARSLLKSSELLVLDEAMSHLDPETEQRILRKLLKMRRGLTTLVITHRLALCSSMDQVMFLRNGRVQAFGPHEQLLRTSVIYRDFVCPPDTITRKEPSEWEDEYQVRSEAVS